MQLEEQSGSSPGSEDQTVIEGQQATENNQATDQPGETEDSLLAVVQSVSAEKAETTESADQPSDSPSAEQSQETTEQQVDDRKEDDFSDVPFNKHPRFRELVKEKNAYKAKLAEYEPDAQQYREIQSFMEKAQLSAEEVAEGLMLMAEMKSGDPVKAYEALTRKVETLALASGKKLPADLEQRIEQGYVDRETAESLYQQQVAAQRQAAQAQAQLEQRTRKDAQAQVQAIAGAVATWESATRAGDPDFDLKADFVKDRVRAHMAAHGMPKSAEEALQISRQAYEAVTQTLQRARGPKPAMRPAVGGKVNGSAAPEPRNLLDVIRQALSGA